MLQFPSLSLSLSDPQAMITLSIPFPSLPTWPSTSLLRARVCVCGEQGCEKGCREACWSVSSAGVPGLAPGVHTRANEREKSRRDEGRAAKLNELRLRFGINISIKR